MERLTMATKKSLIKVIAPRYQKSSKKEQKKILDEFTLTTGYNRSYASYILRTEGKVIRISSKILIKADVTKKVPRKRKIIYDEKVITYLKFIWRIMDFICGKRLKPILPEIIENLETHKVLLMDQETKEKLHKISPATIDRKLALERKKQQLKGRSHTKPGTLLKHQIPIKTFREWDNAKPGFVEIDLVGHDGGNLRGDVCYTLDMTDVATCWTDTMAIKNKAQVWTLDALDKLRKNLPFSLSGIDSDNGSEFINSHLFAYCQKEQLTFTRSRSYKKNDNCYVEQKNWSIVRRAVGYYRYDTAEELVILNELYSYLRFYTNHFQPVMKLLQKTRVGSKVTKKYDKPKTPYQRVLESPFIPDDNKLNLREIHNGLNVYLLKTTIEKYQKQLDLIQKKKGNLKEQIII